MASGTNKPAAGTSDSLVKWYVSHDYDVVEIFDKVGEKFPTVNRELISNYINKWSDYLGKDVAIPGVTPLTERQRANLLQGLGTKGIERLTVDVSYFSPKQGEYVSDSWYVDVPAGLSDADQKTYVDAQIVARFNEEYQLRLATSADVAKFISGVSIRE